MNPRRAQITLSFSFSVIMIMILLSPVCADELLVSTNKLSYGLGATIEVHGALSLGGGAVTNGLVAVQIEDKLGNLMFIRVAHTGVPPPPWKVRIVEFISCDLQGNPKTSFRRDSLAYFRFTVENFDNIFERQVIIALNLFDSVGVSIAVQYARVSLSPGKQFTLLTSMPIPSDAFIGSAVGCANALTNWPKDDGYAYCPEKQVMFNITSTGSSQNVTSALSSTGSEGSYSLSFKLPSTSEVLGNHHVYVSAQYNAWATTIFDYYWISTDVNRDGAVNIVDISVAGKAFGTKIGDLKYNRFADISGDNAVNILDLSAIAKDLGKIMRRA
jgi:hypothetical protein